MVGIARIPSLDCLFFIRGGKGSSHTFDEVYQGSENDFSARDAMGIDCLPNRAHIDASGLVLDSTLRSPRKEDTDLGSKRWGPERLRNVGAMRNEYEDIFADNYVAGF